MSQLEELTRRVREFRDRRDWEQFHTIKNLCGALSIEAAELQEILQWVEGAEAEAEAQRQRDRISDELADIASYLLLIADRLGVSIEEAIMAKLERNEQRYPVDRARGNATKYTDL